MSRTRGQLKTCVCVGALALTTLPSLAVGGDEIRELQKLAAADLRVATEHIQDYALAHNSYPGPRSTFVTIERLEGALAVSALFPAHDPWGRPYWYWTNGEHFIIGSGGLEAADARWSAELEGNSRGAKAALDAMCGSPGRGAVLVVDGRFCGLSKDITHGPPGVDLSEFDRELLTVRDVRDLAKAISAYSIDNNTYPVLTGGTAGVGDLRPVLEPHYIRTVPLTDAWDHPYIYWSDGESFLIFSAGSDGEDLSYGSILDQAPKPAEALASLCTGPSDWDGADIVFANGEPCRWPRSALED